MKDKRRFLKSAFAILCVTTLTLGSSYAGRLQRVEANDGAGASPVAEAETMEFGKESSAYLQLEKPLVAMPNGVEATVGLSELPGSWTLYSAEELKTKYSAAGLTTATAEDITQGLPEGTQYVKLDIGADQFAAATEFIRTTYDIRVPYQYEVADMVLQVWIKNAGESAITWNAGCIELTSERKPDWGEIAYTFSNSNAITLKPGWNLVQIPLSDMPPHPNTERPVFNLQGVNFMRWYGQTSFNGQALCFSDIDLVAIQGEEQYAWTVLEGGSTENVQWNAAHVEDKINTSATPVTTGTTTADDATGAGMGYIEYPYSEKTFSTVSNNLAIDVSRYELKDLAIGMWIYTDTTTVSAGGHLRISNNTLVDNQNSHSNYLNYNMFNFKVGATGWNYVEISLDKWTDNGFSLDELITGFAVWKVKGTSNAGDAGIGTVGDFKIGEVKLVVRNVCKEQKEVGTLAKASDYNIKPSSGTDTIAEQLLCMTATNLPTNAPDGLESGMIYSRATIPAYDSNDATTGKMIILNPTFAAPEGILAYEQDELALEFYFYSNQERSLPTGCQMELRSNGNVADDYELNWNTGSIHVQKGWNKITLNLKDAGSSKKEESHAFNLADVSSFRWYITPVARQSITEDWTISITDLKLVAIDDAATAKATVAVSTSDATTMKENFMVFSNSNTTEETNPYALFVTKEGKPALLYGTTQITLNKKLPLDADVTLRVVRDETDGTFAFYEITDGTAGALVGKSTTAVSTVLDAPETKHCIGADAAGGQLMYGSIKGLKLYSDTACTQVSGDWGLDGSSKWLLNTMKDASGNANHAKFVFDTADAANYAPAVLKYTGVSAGTAPEDARMNGYVFAGWFTDSECEKGSALTAGTSGVTAYAKYVDASVLTAKAQVSSNVFDEDTANDDSASLRFVTTVDSDAYTKVGFRIIANGHTKEVGGEKIYDVLYAVGTTSDNKGVELEYYPTYFSLVSTAFKTYTVTDIPKASFDTDFEVTPYWITLDGTQVYGAVSTKTVQAGIDAYRSMGQ